MKLFIFTILCVLLTKICCQNSTFTFGNVRPKRRADRDDAPWSGSEIYKPRRRLSGDVIERQAALDHGYRQRIYNQWTKEWDMRVDMNSHYWPTQNRPFANYAPRGPAGGGLRPLGESLSEGQLLLPNRQILTPSFERNLNEAHLDNIMRNSQRSSLPVSSITTYPSDSSSFASSPSSYSSISSPISSVTTYPSESPSSLSSSDALRSLPASFKELYRSKMHPNIAENAARPRPFPVAPSPQQSPRISQPPPPPPASNVPPTARGRGGIRNRFRNLRQNIGQRFRRFFGRKK